MNGTATLAPRDAKAGRRIAGLLERPNPFGTFRMVPRAELLIDRKYQRPVSERRAKMIASDFVPELFLPLWVADRAKSGKLYVVDGQHRLYAADLIGIDYMPELPCMIYLSASAKDEMMMFVWLQEKRRRLSSFHAFNVKLSYGDPAATALQALIIKHGFELMDPNTFGGRTGYEDNVIKSIAVLEMIYAQHGDKGVDDVLWVIRKAWNGVGPSLSAMMLRSVNRLLESETIARTKLAQALGTRDPWGLIDAATRKSHNDGITNVEALKDVLSRYANA